MKQPLVKWMILGVAWYALGSVTAFAENRCHGWGVVCNEMRSKGNCESNAQGIGKIGGPSAYQCAWDGKHCKLGSPCHWDEMKKKGP